MARLQILELPSGSDDERPPFLLVLDQVAPEMVEAICAAERTTAELIGARAIFTFEETIEIPANQVGATAEPLLRVGEPTGANDAERAGITQIVYAHERTRLDLCSALLLDSGTTWRKLIEHVAEQQQIIAHILDLPEQPQAMVPGKPPMEDYLHGYGVGVRAAKRIARNEPTRPAEDGR